MSEVTRESWSAVYDMAVIEFLNILAYRRDKNEKQKREQNQWKRTH